MAAPTEFLQKIKNLNEEKKYEEVIDLLPDNILEEYRDADLYAEAAQAYYRLKKNDLCKEAGEKAIELNPEQAKAYYYLGNIYMDFRQFDNAIIFYNNSIKANPNLAYPYNGRGNVYYRLKQYDKALEAYNKAIETDPKDSHPYNGLGNVYRTLKQNNKAIEYYNKAINIDPEKEYAYYNRALLFYNNKQYKQAKKDFEKYIRFTIDDDSIYRRYAKDKIEEINKLMGDGAFIEISELVNKIKTTLLFTEDCITHYTTMTALGFLLLKKSPQRLSEGAYLNDTSEGRELFKYLAFEDDIRRGLDTDAELFAVKPFIGSFVAESKYDDLTLWRMYGKENKEEAKGCAITMHCEILIKKIKEKLLAGRPDGNISVENDLQFYRVAYRDKDAKQPFSIPGKGVKKGTESNLNKDMADLKQKVTAYEEERKDKPLTDKS